MQMQHSRLSWKEGRGCREGLTHTASSKFSWSQTTTWSVNDYEMFFLGKTGISGVCLVYHLAGTERLVINCLVV